MSRDERERDPIASIDAARRDRRGGTLLAREALARAADGPQPRTEVLLARVPSMLAEARRRRGRRDALSASVPLARVAIPRLAAAAALLVAVSVGLVLTAEGESSRTAPASWDQVLVAGGTVSDDVILSAMLGEEGERVAPQEIEP